MNSYLDKMSSMDQFNFNVEDYIGQAIICVTYDDGLKNNFDLAVPAHLNSGVTATFSVIAHRTVSPQYWDRFVRPYELACMDSLGFEISSHGYYHEKKFIDMDAKELHTELVESKKILEGIMPSRKKIVSICVPFGSANDNVIKKSFESYGIVRLSAYKNIGLDRVMEEPLPAYPVLNNTKPEQVFKWIDKAVNEKKVIVLMLHGIAEDTQGKGDYYYSIKALEEILAYIASLGKEKLLPLCLRDLEALQVRDSNMKSTISQEKKNSEINNHITSKVLANEAGYMITLHEHKVSKSNKLIITFGGLPSTKTTSGFGTDFALKLGFDTIYVAQEVNTQYQELSLESFYKHIKEVIKGRDCITYGSSLGAYSAIYYGGVINALIIAAAPKNSAHPSLAHGRFKDIVFKHKDLKDIPKSNKPPVLIYDPYHKEEVNFIDKYVRPAYDSLRVVEVPFGGHTVLNTMKLSGVLTDFMINLIEKNNIIQFVMKTNDCYVWNAEISRFYFGKGEAELAILHAKKSLDLQLNKEALGYLVNYYLHLEQYENLKMIYQDYVVRKKIEPTQASIAIFKKYIK